MRDTTGGGRPGGGPPRAPAPGRHPRRGSAGGRGGGGGGGGGRPPYPPVAPLLRRRIRADLITDRIVGEAYGVLNVTERLDLIRLLGQTAERARVPTAEYPVVR